MATSSNEIDYAAISAQIDLLLDADPSLRGVWNAFQLEWKGEENPPLYVFLGDVARDIVRRLEANDTTAFHAIFDVVERWHLDTNAAAREAATIGLLEDLQNPALYRTGNPDTLYRWLGPESLLWWDKLNAFWTRGDPLA